ncbi:MAG: MBL fold metallo-hydrolase [Candidatus Woesearchaeota archaeon]
MNIHMYGAGQEVGRSCIELAWGSKRILLDAGIKLDRQGNEYPLPIRDAQDIDMVFLSHAHLDHCGALPYIVHQGVQSPIFTNALTKELTITMLKDSWKVDRLRERTSLFPKTALSKAIQHIQPVKKGKYKGVQYEFIASGHIPGSSSILLKYNGTSVLYTGDITKTPTKLVKEHQRLPKADVLIIEATYGDKQHPQRGDVQQEFKRIITETLQKGGSVMVAVFAIGRSQEMLLLLDEMNLQVPIYLDGMSKTITQTLLKYPYHLKDKSLHAVYKKVHLVSNHKVRQKAIKQQGVFVTTSGMLDGGPIMEYLKQLGSNPAHTILLTGYQADDSNGRMLIEQGKVVIDGVQHTIKAQLHHLNFSGHASQQDLHAIIDSVQPKVVITNHGEPTSTKELATYAQQQKMIAYAPKTGQTITINEVDR